MSRNVFYRVAPDFFIFQRMGEKGVQNLAVSVRSRGAGPGFDTVQELPEHFAGDVADERRGVARVKVFEERIEPASVTNKRTFRVPPFEAVQIRFNGAAQGDALDLAACQRIEKIFAQTARVAGIAHQVKARKFLFSLSLFG